MKSNITAHSKNVTIISLNIKALTTQASRTSIFAEENFALVEKTLQPFVEKVDRYDLND